MSIIEILDSEAINSNMQGWINEADKFREWYLKLSTNEVDEIELTKACLKIEPKNLQPHGINRIFK